MILTRRAFIKLSAATAVGLSLPRFPVAADTLPVTAVMTRRAGCLLLDPEMFRFIEQEPAPIKRYIPFVVTG